MDAEDGRVDGCVWAADVEVGQHSVASLGGPASGRSSWPGSGIVRTLLGCPAAVSATSRCLYAFVRRSRTSRAWPTCGPRRRPTCARGSSPSCRWVAALEPRGSGMNICISMTEPLWLPCLIRGDTRLVSWRVCARLRAKCAPVLLTPRRRCCLASRCASCASWRPSPGLTRSWRPLRPGSAAGRGAGLQAWAAAEARTVAVVRRGGIRGVVEGGRGVRVGVLPCLGKAAGRWAAHATFVHQRAVTPTS
jgi:hypothetical protein